MKIKTQFDFGEKVLLKLSGGIEGLITGIVVNPSALTYNVTYWLDGEQKTVICFDFELEGIEVNSPIGFAKEEKKDDNIISIKPKNTLADIKETNENFNAMATAIAAKRPAHFDFDTIVYYTSEFFNLTKSQILSNSRKRTRVIARAVIAHFARKYLSLSLSEIGEKLNRQDHTTIINSLETFKKIEDPYELKSIELIEKELNSQYSPNRKESTNEQGKENLLSDTD